MTWEADTCSLPHTAAPPFCSAHSLACTRGVELMSRSVGGSWGIRRQGSCSLLGGTSGYMQVPRGSLQQRQLYHSQKEKENSDDVAKRSCVSPGAAPRDVCVAALLYADERVCSRKRDMTSQCPAARLQRAPRQSSDLPGPEGQAVPRAGHACPAGRPGPLLTPTSTAQPQLSRR